MIPPRNFPQLGDCYENYLHHGKSLGEPLLSGLLRNEVGDSIASSGLTRVSVVMMRGEELKTFAIYNRDIRSALGIVVVGGSP